jgi:N-methylhydantoinase B
MVSYSNGGGGFGDPAQRDPEKVARDVREGWISAQRGREIYKVALDMAGNVDSAATAALRA